MQFWDREIGEKDNIDLEYAEQVLKGERSGTEQGVQERFNLQPHSEEALENSEDPVYDAVAEELIQTLYGQAMNKDENYKERVEGFERALKKFNPEPYIEVVDNNHTYSVEHLTDTNEMMVSADASGSCISNRENDFEDYAEDEYSMISAVRKDGETLGYLRNFLMEDEEGREFLAVDTIEIDHKNFEHNKDVVRAAGMASVQMMYDLEADYLVGSDARVKYGVRQAYSNTEKSVRGHKIGERDLRSYSFNTIEDVNKSAYLLMDNPGN